ncbi:sugar ABC transporter substrate-binding protein [Marinobacterium nitratireducens]|uniref:Sugar ABC transporter substrate-binding protein n=1 Tax=Marinobacterium nitratireducens TaxID=518897 RepID=A0A917ZJ59_9GAMM|nr:substrate-binding domain-containing protein [Marinobacterium nitratireducens]GGO84511.1 sugar ABC transporter substrate-binding protein [Marinobacterium nitratireducens]
MTFPKLVMTCLVAMSMLLTSTAVPAKMYRFVMVSHIGAQDPNMNWLTLALADFEKHYPNVFTEYVGGETNSAEELASNLQRVIATDPDGIAVSVTDAAILEGPIRKALDKGIPVVAFNVPDSRPADERIPYMTYVGGDEYLTGYKTGIYALEKARAGDVPMPTKVVCALLSADHAGLRERCRGIEDAFRQVGATADYLVTGIEREQFQDTLRDYLGGHPEANYILNMGDFTAPWSWRVSNELGLDPDVDDRGMTILAVGVGPIGLSGIKNGHLLVTSEQGFWLQGYIPMEWLYWYLEMGYRAQSDIITGPVMVDMSNLDKMDKLSRAVFGAGSENASAWKP